MSEQKVLSELQQIKIGIKSILEGMEQCSMVNGDEFFNSLTNDSFVDMLEALLTLTPDIPTDIESTTEWFENNLDHFSETIQIMKLKTTVYALQELLIEDKCKLDNIEHSLLSNDEKIKRIMVLVKEQGLVL